MSKPLPSVDELLHVALTPTRMSRDVRNRLRSTPAGDPLPPRMPMHTDAGADLGSRPQLETLIRDVCAASRLLDRRRRRLEQAIHAATSGNK
jgi:hypothetical protein